MQPDKEPSPEMIEKMLEQNKVKTVPPQILKGFKGDVMRRIASEPPGPRVKPGRWLGSGWKLPRVGMSVGAGALACLVIASLAVFTTQVPNIKGSDAPSILEPAQSRSFQVASLPTAAQTTAPMAALNAASMPARSIQADTASQKRITPVPTIRRLTVEEELRLIEEFDDQRFFIRQDIKDDALGAA
jgi:hypothetical protein